MDKVIDLLDQELLASRASLAGWQHDALARALHALGREAARLVPDEGMFRQRAEILMDVLVADDMFANGVGRTDARRAAGTITSSRATSGTAAAA
jgi:hypothetical protein